MLSEAVVSEIMPEVDGGKHIGGTRSTDGISTGDLFPQPYNGSN